MKLRLVLVVLLFMPLLMTAQQEDPGTDPGRKKDGVIFYSKGKMYVKYKTDIPSSAVGEPESTTLYIDGSAKFATHSAIVQKGRTELTGDFINAKDPSVVDEDAPHLFVGFDDTKEDDGVFAFIGGYYNDGTNDRSTRQWILGSDSTEQWLIADQKRLKFINFPTLHVNKPAPTAYDDWRMVSVVTVDTTAAVGVNFIKVDTDNKNRFAVRAAYTDDDRISSGYALIKKEHSLLDPSVNNGIPSATYSQVDFNLYNFKRDASGNVTVDDGAFDNDYTATATPKPENNTLRFNKDNNGVYWNRLIGFSPPFKELAADYMFYHVLTKPNGSSVTSGTGPIVDPYYKMQAGYGYFTTMEMSHGDHIDNINERWDFEEDLVPSIFVDNTFQQQEGIHHTKRARGGYVFNRMAFEDYASAIRGDLTYNPLADKTKGGPQENFRRYTYDPTREKTTGLDSKWEDADGSNRSRIELLQNEKFNTGEVEVKLKPGLNFLGNPFMAPISLNCLLGIASPYESNAAANYPSLTDTQADQFNVAMLGGVSVSMIQPTKGELRTKYWLIDRAYGRYDADKNMFLYSISYNYISRYGATEGTATEGSALTNIPEINPQEYLVAPMQMFALQASDQFGSEITIKLNPGMRAFGQTRFQKSASSDAGFKEFKQDWFVVEVQDEINKIADRTSVIFRDGALLQTTQDAYDTKKGLNDSFDSYEQEVKDINGFVSKQKQDVATAIVYTKSSDNVALLGNAIPKKTKELPLFFDKPEGSRPMKLKFYGIENIEAVEGVWLVDRYLDNKVVEVTPGFQYTFESTAADTDNLAGGNRFVLRFYPDDQDVINKEDTPIVCYYNTSMLYLKGLIEDDANSDVTLYDMQGRLMAKTKISSSAAVNGTMEYLKPLSFGTYIVKITGKRNHTAKFVNLQTK